ncbi:hypothetical protein GQ55_8G048500 [Panicum hallii var. hallii]|uniref:Uncharacterized protein n=1 Tax=Panicum hallii var. hallii TaxID=1504633 RepID=A0A2T7CKT3_9POAL|nr:hypothetical protein GQ55_8G048500 [Panicum hallii var. hallii]
MGSASCFVSFPSLPPFPFFAPRRWRCLCTRSSTLVRLRTSMLLIILFLESDTLAVLYWLGTVSLTVTHVKP